MRRSVFSILGAVTLIIASSIPLRAAEKPMTPDEYVNRLPYLHPKPTTDATPVKIRVGSVVYEIPRNYIKSAVELMPTLWITYPQFQPPTPEMRCSSKNQLPVGPSDCVIIELTIHGGIDPATGHPLPNSILFQRMTKNNPTTQGPFPGPTGMQIYHQGSTGTQNRTEIYKTSDYKTIFYCGYGPNKNPRFGLCIDEITLDDANEVHVFLPTYLITYVPDFESHVRGLVASFKHERVN